MIRMGSKDPNTNTCTDLATPSKDIAYQVTDRQSEWAKTADRPQPSVTTNANVCPTDPNLALLRTPIFVQKNTETSAKPMIIA